jgi:dTDP-4-amino-4,6-dideoxygalactose transaminase
MKSGIILVGGGMAVGNDEERMEHIKFLVHQGRDKLRGYYYPEIRIQL